MQNSNKKILFIAYHFPPSRAIGGKRIAAFARYLQDFGWQSHVVTIKEKEIEQTDPESLAKLQNVAIYRTGKLPSLRDIYLCSKASLRRGKKNKITTATSDNTVTTPSGCPNFRRKVKHFLASLVYLPDEHRNWIISAVFTSLQLIRKEKITYILTSCPPYSTHLAGLLIKTLHPRIRWISDFRDPWMVPIEKPVYPKTTFSKFFDYAFEKSVITKCSLVLTTTKNYSDTLAQFYSSVPKEKFQVIPNGFEQDDLPENNRTKFSTFTICYIGSLYFGRSPEPLFQATRQLLNNNIFTEDDIDIKLVGHCHAINDAPTGEIVNNYNLNNVVEIIDSIPQRLCFEMIQRSHIALLLAPQQPFQIPGKSYEYIGLGTPILALTEQGSTMDLLCSIRSTKVIHPENITEIAEYIQTQYLLKNSPMTLETPEILQFSRRRTVDKLAQHLTALK